MRRFADELRDAGARVTKVNFHAGDVFFFPGPDAIAFRGTRAEWPAWVRRLLVERDIDTVFLFGDCRPLHEAAISVAEAIGARVWVFEEGYLRPDWITLEEHGVNGKSRMPRDRAAFAIDAEPPERRAVGSSFGASGWYSTLNALAFTLLNRGFPHYEHHRNLNAWYHTACWVRSAFRRSHFKRRERHVLARLSTQLSKRYFFVPLQVHCDFQLRYSKYTDVVDFILDVVETFRDHASPDDSIVFKHHPMDRPFRDYSNLFASLAKRHGLGERLHYVHDLHLPTLLRHAKGTITINSTVGLQSLQEGTPVVTLGQAVYDFPGMMATSSLREFLADPGKVDAELVALFRSWLLHANQANGNFYVRTTDTRRGTGVRWFPGISQSTASVSATMRSPARPSP